MTITEAFDIDETMIGQQIGQVTIKHIDRLKEILAKKISMLQFDNARKSGTRCCQSIS